MRRGRGWHGEHCPLLMSPVKPTNYYPAREKGCVRACVLLGERLKFCVDVQNVLIFISNQESLRGKKKMRIGEL